ncbi:MAG: bis(5'-nucleosyl)-tetraphosphatase (symmetrical) YqeK [Bacillota bacterium]|nr:bis(5'-nucleosyl)-tetraphosphatase (symmetrical) YqeK [Bacillota bacterium]
MNLTEAVAARMAPVRFCHARRVAELARRLAERHGYDGEKAFVAGLLHDLARDVELSLLLQKALAFGIVKHKEEVLVPVLLHGPVAAALAAQEFGVHDPEILEAIAVHSTGAPQMGGVAQAVFVADAVEPGRTYPAAETGRRLAEQDLRCAVAFVARQSLRYLKENGKPVDPRTEETYQAFASSGTETGGR